MTKQLDQDKKKGVRVLLLIMGAAVCKTSAWQTWRDPQSTHFSNLRNEKKCWSGGGDWCKGLTRVFPRRFFLPIIGFLGSAMNLIAF